jgi:hypothetical protein
MKTYFIHIFFCFVGHKGYDYVVPLVTREKEDFSEQQGVLLNKGWIPAEFKSNIKKDKI